MSSTFQKLKFKEKKNQFYTDLNKLTRRILTKKMIQKGNLLMKLKFVFYALIFIASYLCLFILPNQIELIIINYICIGLFGILLAFNCAHDAVHNTFSQSKKLNKIIYYITFNLQGVNSGLWKKRHMASHHIFPNVDGCDADIDDNPFLRLSKSHALKPHHKYQHLYASFIYCLYTLHWIFIKDFIYLNKKNFANLKNQTYSIPFKIELIALKLFYILYMVVIPYYLTEISMSHILLSFFIMHFVISIFFVLTLVISHLNTETVFPATDKNGVLPYDYYEHQLAVSLDYHPTNNFANWIVGGFNSHAAHHLFPHLPHTLYTNITPAIKRMAHKYKLPYNELGISKAILSHYSYLKELGKA
jgi:linoleoyl-CoA desaturase